MTDIGCRDQCGSRAEDDQAALLAGWSYLLVTASWRCPACAQAMRQAWRLNGAPNDESPDRLPATSRGALQRETASTIAPPVVKS